MRLKMTANMASGRSLMWVCEERAFKQIRLSLISPSARISKGMSDQRRGEGGMSSTTEKLVIFDSELSIQAISEANIFSSTFSSALSIYKRIGASQYPATAPLHWSLRLSEPCYRRTASRRHPETPAPTRHLSPRSQNLVSAFHINTDYRSIAHASNYNASIFYSASISSSLGP